MRKISVACKYWFDYPRIQDAANSLEVKSFKAELDRSRMEEMKSMMASLNELRSALESLKTEVFNLKENQIEEVRAKMYDMEEKISHFKGQIHEELLGLVRDEIGLSRDLHFAARRLEEWEKPLNAKILKPPKQSSCKAWKTNDNPAVQFQRFLSSCGGHCGGWPEQDHLLFLRERNKFKGRPKFLSAVHSLLPDLSYEEIEEHEQWYQKYDDLKNSQKEAIKKWRVERETLQTKEKEKTEVEEKRRPIRKPPHQQVKITERIKEWKNQKLLRKLQEEERQKKEKERCKEEEKRRAGMYEMKKQAVIQYRAEKLKKAQKAFPKHTESSLTRETKLRNSLLLKSFRLQDLQFIEKKKVLRLHIESRAQEKAERWRLAKPALELILQRDPQRVFQPTLIWSQHCLEARKRQKIAPVFDLNSIPRLAVPEWRKELK